MDKKYFFFDIDGTLTDIQTGIPVPSALETIKKLNNTSTTTLKAHGSAVWITCVKKPLEFIVVSCSRVIMNDGNPIAIPLTKESWKGVNG